MHRLCRRVWKAAVKRGFYNHIFGCCLRQKAWTRLHHPIGKVITGIGFGRLRQLRGVFAREIGLFGAE